MMLYKFINKSCLIRSGPERQTVTSIQSCASGIIWFHAAGEVSCEVCPNLAPPELWVVWFWSGASELHVHVGIPVLIIKSSSSQKVMRQLFDDILTVTEQLVLGNKHHSLQYWSWIGCLICMVLLELRFGQKLEIDTKIVTKSLTKRLRLQWFTVTRHI